ncbi:MAG: asparagine synthase C-terminal domain-containing protein [Candidatus Nitrosotenuis sp.]
MVDYKTTALDPTTIKNILTLRYNPTGKSPLPKLSWKNFTEKKYDKPQETVENLIQSNIHSMVKNPKQRVSVALSSGVDSTLVLLMLRKAHPQIPVTALSVKFADSIDESKHAARIADRFDADHRIVHVDNYLEELPKAISIIKLPFWDLHWYYLVKAAKKSSRFLVSGDGGDELFGGYTFRYEKFLSQVNHNSSPLTKTKAYLNCHERDWVPDQEKLFGKKARFCWDQIYRILLPYFGNKLDPLSQVFLADFNGKLLYNWMPLNSKFHRYFGVKSITPILSSRLISYATHIPVDLKYDRTSRIGKLLLWKILQKYSADKLLIKRKQGFSADTANLWNSYGYKLCSYYLDDARVVKDGWINQEWLQKHFRKKNLDVRYVNKFLGILALEIWYRMFYTRELKHTEKMVI